MAEAFKNEEISDSDKKMDALMDMIKDACSKIDSDREDRQRMDARMDSFEEKLADKRKDAAGDEPFKEWAKEEAGESEHKKDGRRKDGDEAEREENDDPKEPVADKRKDARKDSKPRADGRRKDEEGDERKADAKRKDGDEEMDSKRRDGEDNDERKDAVADALNASRAEMAAMRIELAALQARTPAMLADSDRVRFAAIQEQADPAFQAFADRAPSPLDGETPIQYKRRLGSKLQAHSPKWGEARLSAVSDETMLDAVLSDVYADAISASRRGADVPRGQLREITHNDGLHVRKTFIGEPAAWMGGFSGGMSRRV